MCHRLPLCKVWCQFQSIIDQFSLVEWHFNCPVFLSIALMDAKKILNYLIYLQKSQMCTSELKFSLFSTLSDWCQHHELCKSFKIIDRRGGNLFVFCLLQGLSLEALPTLSGINITMTTKTRRQILHTPLICSGEFVIAYFIQLDI